MDIAEIAKISRTPASALRFYEERGLIASVGRRGTKRLFDATVLRQLALIALGQAGGFSLDEIAAMFGPDGLPHIDKAQLRAKADEFDRIIRQLEHVRDGLRHIANCNAPNQLECPRFNRFVEIAGKGRFATRLPLALLQKSADKKAVKPR
jgi:MerR family redox-sensitive transcriptional activator SoxR